MSSSAENPSQRDGLPLDSPAPLQASPYGSAAEVDLSIIVPVYFNARELDATLATLRREVVDVIRPLTTEIVFVDDGSGDDSFAVLQRLRKEHPQLVRLVKLTRNFGQANDQPAAQSCAHVRAKPETHARLPAPNA